MPDSPQGVFLSYRRAEAGPYAQILRIQLKQRIPGARIFMDLDSIEPGLDFADVIQDALKSCTVLVAFIGRQWATLTDEDGVRRLDKLDDYVRFEVKTALERGVRVIPVLIDGAKALRQEELPAELHKLGRLQAAKLSYEHYQDDVDRLIGLIQRVVAGADPKAEEVADPKSRAEADPKAEEEADRKAQEQADRQAWENQLRRKEEQARAAGKAGDAARARVQFASLLPERERVSGPEHRDTLTARADLAYWTGEAGDAAGARDQWDALLSVRERMLGPEDPATLEARADLARWTGEAGDAAGARDQYAALLSVRERVLGPDDPKTLRTRLNLARWTGEAGDADGARAQYAELAPIIDRLRGAEDPDTITARTQARYWAMEDLKKRGQRLGRLLR